MRSIILVIFFLTTCASVPKNIGRHLNPGREVILYGKSGLEFFLNNPSVSFWTPNKKDIKGLAKKMNVLLQEKKDLKTLTLFGELRVQYVGIYQDGKKMIFCNFFHTKTITNDDDDWKLVPVMPSSGWNLFQAYYDVSAKNYANLYFYGTW